MDWKNRSIILCRELQSCEEFEYQYDLNNEIEWGQEIFAFQLNAQFHDQVLLLGGKILRGEEVYERELGALFG